MSISTSGQAERNSATAGDTWLIPKFTGAEIRSDPLGVACIAVTMLSASAASASTDRARSK
jgi:hypothetical protein